MTPATDLHKINDLRARDVDHGVVRMEGAVGALEGVGNVLDFGNDRVTEEPVVVEAARVADDADDGLFRADHDGGLETLGLDVGDQLPQALLRGLGFRDDDHGVSSFFASVGFCGTLR